MKGSLTGSKFAFEGRSFLGVEAPEDMKIHTMI
jgi:hypothetical protein